MANPQYVYVMTKLNKTYPGGKQVLKDVTLAFLPGAKIGVVGVNGAGKSTLLRIMAGDEKEFTGEAWAAEGVRVGYLDCIIDDMKKVDSLHDSARTIITASRTCAPPIRGALGEVRRLRSRTAAHAARLASKETVPNIGLSGLRKT